ncbi:MAG: hypothetical protein KAR55_04680, partial [Thermoplasmatales archaeon]|nr:hypothetical protein [Thermoplasmatales archaeon]
FRPMTSSGNYKIRLFYFLMSVLMYNLWILIRILNNITVHGRKNSRSKITAYVFKEILNQFGLG